MAVQTATSRRDAAFKRRVADAAHDNFEQIFGAKMPATESHLLLEALDDMLHHIGRRSRP